MKKATRFFLIGATGLATLVAANEASAQDFHFSQFYNSPLSMNPAMAGSFNGDMRGVLNYKDQWKSLGSTFKTFAASFDQRMMQKKWKKGYLGAGISLFNDKAGAGQMSTTQVNLSIASSRAITASTSISVGLQGGAGQKSVNMNGLTWDSQYDQGQGKWIDQPSGEPTAANFNFGDFAGGINFHYGSSASTLSSKNSIKFDAGAAMFHINKPNQSYYGNKDPLYSKIITHARLIYGIANSPLSVLPGFMYAIQGPSQELLVGGLVRYTLSENSRYTGNVKESAVSLGGYMRAKDSFIAIAEIEVANYALGLSYDVNVSSLRTASGSKGGLELCLKYVNPNPFRNKSSARF